MFTKNLGTLDRLFRLILGIVLIGLAYTGKIGAWGYIGIIPLATALLSSCLLYRIFGINTASKN